MKKALLLTVLLCMSSLVMAQSRIQQQKKPFKYRDSLSVLENKQLLMHGNISREILMQRDERLEREISLDRMKKQTQGIELALCEEQVYEIISNNDTEEAKKLLTEPLYLGENHEEFYPIEFLEQHVDALDDFVVLGGFFQITRNKGYKDSVMKEYIESVIQTPVTERKELVTNIKERIKQHVQEVKELAEQ